MDGKKTASEILFKVLFCDLLLGTYENLNFFISDSIEF